ncbi:SWIM zinc finger family protein [Streptomyces physcomitrii]|uniref:SWIM zinc finger family protein n=1 Tax=Streptomyces physcomitrii TaxID=2724184 RepID=A0ABX1GXN1_9ACTN|nr:SWIM zinc finger family protein [Streptomyces physcomitrii]NKI40553.1 SWIM zinc finger family protein [Streptomyces physcomitrii]
MNQQGVRWTADQVLALAPDASSRKAGSKLGTAGPWSDAGSTGAGTVWGLCRGSGSKPYQTVVDLADTAGPAYKCSCPSRKFPCKHALGLLLLWSGADPAVAGGEPPGWAEEWLAGRRARAQQKHEGEGSGAARPKTADPAAAAKRAARRAERISAGASELEQRLGDLLRGGLASAEQAGYGLWEETAARMVDAQAPGLASRVRELGAVPASGPGWPVRLLEECALAHLLGQGWLRRASLPPELAATVAARVGLPPAGKGPAVRDDWLVLARYDTAEGHLVTRRTWVHGARSEQTALLLSFGAAGRAPALALPVGLSLDAELSAHPGGGGLRADLGEQFAAPGPGEHRPAGVGPAEALDRYGRALREDPWLESWPVTLRAAVPARAGEGWQLADPEQGTALPLAPAAQGKEGLWRLIALSGGAPVTVFGECGHRGFTPLAAWEPAVGEVVSLC